MIVVAVVEAAVLSVLVTDSASPSSFKALVSAIIFFVIWVKFDVKLKPVELFIDATPVILKLK